MATGMSMAGSQLGHLMRMAAESFQRRRTPCACSNPIPGERDNARLGFYCHVCDGWISDKRIYEAQNRPYGVALESSDSAGLVTCLLSEKTERY
jgi:hypothetical protein